VGAAFHQYPIISVPERQPIENNELVSIGSGMNRGDLLIYSTIFHGGLRSTADGPGREDTRLRVGRVMPSGVEFL